MNYKTLVVIPAKGDSNRLHKKSLSLYNGKSLVANTIIQSQKSKLVDNIVVDSDSDDILEEAKRYNVNTHKRKILEDVDILEILKDVILEEEYKDYNIIVLLQVDCPFRGNELIDKCIQRFLDGDSINKELGSQSYQDVITVIRGKRTGTIRVISRDALLCGLPTSHIGIIEDDANYVDIHTKDDLDKANQPIPKCVICGSDNVHRFHEEDSLWKCYNCSLVFQYPQNDFNYSEYSNTREELRQKRIIQYAEDIKIIKQYKTQGKFLDVGCGDGTFLNYIDYPFIKDGIDIRGKYRIGNFPEYEFNSTYDIVHMRATLEHVKNPRAYISKAYDILNKGGLIAITHIPNINNYPKMKGLIKKDEHLIYFNPESIVYLLKDCGFEILDVRFPYYEGPYKNDKGSAFMNVMSVYGEK